MATDKTPNSDTEATGPSLSEMKRKAKPAAAKPVRKTASPAPSEKPIKAPSSKTPRTKSGIGFGTAAVMSVLAAAIGGAIGWAGPKIFDPANAAPAKTIQSQGQRIVALNETIDAQAKQIAGLNTKLTATQKSVSGLSGLPARINSLETAERARASIDITAEREAAISPIAARLDAVETLMQTEDMPEGSVSALLERLANIEAGLEEIQSRPPVASEPSLLTYSSPDSPSDNSSEAIGKPKADTVAQTYDLVANFPRAQMLAALQAQTQSSANPSWLRRIMEKHIDIKDVGGAEARGVILEAEALTKAGNISAAIDAIESLNPTLRAAARPWLIEAKKSL